MSFGITCYSQHCLNERCFAAKGQMELYGHAICLEARRASCSSSSTSNGWLDFVDVTQKNEVLPNPKNRRGEPKIGRRMLLRRIETGTQFALIIKFADRTAGMMRIEKPQVDDTKTDLYSETMSANGKSDGKKTAQEQGVYGTVNLTSHQPDEHIKTGITTTETTQGLSTATLPPQTFKGEWKECWEVGMKVKLSTSSRGDLPATITRVWDKFEKCDLELSNGDVVQGVYTFILQFPDDYLKQIQGVPPPRLDTSKAGSNTNTAKATTTGVKKEEPSAAESILGFILIMLVILTAVIYFK